MAELYLESKNNTSHLFERNAIEIKIYDFACVRCQVCLELIDLPE